MCKFGPNGGSTVVQLEGHQKYQGSSSGDHVYLQQIQWKSDQKSLKYLSLDKNVGWTDYMK